MKLISLTQNKVAFIDDEDFDRLSKFKWHAKEWHNTWCAARNIPRANGKQTLIRMHWEILRPPRGMDTDHKDHNGLNNQKSNLRIATRAENMRNMQKRKGCTSQYKGVCWHRRSAKWRAYITVKGRQISLGHFDSEEEAAFAYDMKAHELFGEFALTNFRD